jgi:hypothetical protein
MVLSVVMDILRMLVRRCLKRYDVLFQRGENTTRTAARALFCPCFLRGGGRGWTQRAEISMEAQVGPHRSHQTGRSKIELDRVAFIHDIFE